MDQRMLILAGVAAAAFFILKKKSDTGAALPGLGSGSGAASGTGLSSFFGNLLTPAPAPATAKAPAPAPAPAYDNGAHSPAPAPAATTLNVGGGNSAWQAKKKTTWDEAANRVIFDGGYIDYNTGIRHHDDGSSGPVASSYLQIFKNEALGQQKYSFIGTPILQ